MRLALAETAVRFYSDGESVNITLCGDAVLNNRAGKNAFGGGVFFTSNNWDTPQGGTLSIADTTMTGNTGGSLDASCRRQCHESRHGRGHERQEHHGHEFHHPGRPLGL